MIRIRVLWANTFLIWEPVIYDPWTLTYISSIMTQCAIITNRWNARITLQSVIYEVKFLSYIPLKRSWIEKLSLLSFILNFDLKWFCEYHSDFYLREIENWTILIRVNYFLFDLQMHKEWKKIVMKWNIQLS